MRAFQRLLATIAVLAVAAPVFAGDRDLIPPQLAKPQQNNLLRFLEQHQKPNSYIPENAKIVGTLPGGAELPPRVPPVKPVKQYTVQIVAHRPVPDQPEPNRVDVYYYRPNPEKGKPGVTVRYTVDLTSGNQVGQTEVLLNQHTAMSQEEVTEAVALAREKSDALKEIYRNREANQVRYEYLQMKVNTKNGPHDPGDRVVRLVFTAPTPDGEAAAKPLAVIVNLTKEIVAADAR